MSSHGNPDDLCMLLRVTRLWQEGMTDDELYGAARGWWVVSERRLSDVTTVLAVAGGVVRAVYRADRWERSTTPGLEHRWGFDGSPSPTRQEWVGLDVSSLFRPGSANPVLYAEVGRLAALTAATAEDDAASAVTSAASAQGANGSAAVDSEPGLEESLTPLLRELRDDLLWSMSRAGQELFHSNTLAHLIEHHPVAIMPVRTLLEGENAGGAADVWRELHHLDLVGRSGGSRFVVENKLYSVPYPEQLRRYAEVSLPWSAAHGGEGAADTEYVLLSLMEPAFLPPAPWRVVTYSQLAEALGRVDASAFGHDEPLVSRYRALVRRLVDLQEVVDPRSHITEPFDVDDLLDRLELTWFRGPMQRLRYTGLAQAVLRRLDVPRDFAVGLTNSTGLVQYLPAVGEERFVGWQLQGFDLRLVVGFTDPDLYGRGDSKKLARAQQAEKEWSDWFDFTQLDERFGGSLTDKGSKPGRWNHFDPDFVYRYRRVSRSTTTEDLTELLAWLTERTDLRAGT